VFWSPSEGPLILELECSDSLDTDLEWINYWIQNMNKIWRVSSSGMWRRVVCWVATDVSEEHIASIFRVEEIISASKQVASLLAGSCWNYFFDPEDGGVCSSETSVATQQTTQRHIPDDTLHNHRCENLKSYMNKICPTIQVHIHPYKQTTPWLWSASELCRPSDRHTNNRQMA
jgi:hypothetical protein